MQVLKSIFRLIVFYFFLKDESCKVCIFINSYISITMDLTRKHKSKINVSLFIHNAVLISGAPKRF